jgi:hypothetical protein
MNNKSFALLVAVIFNLNNAMESAAKNPMDDWRRQNVQTAFRMLPPAIVGLADEFKANKFKNSDLPLVQKMLGGFVNVKAAEGMKRFMDKPDKSLIPKLGNTFPYALASKGAGAVAGNSDSRQLVMSDTAKPGKGLNNGSAPAGMAFGGDQNELANLNDEATFGAPNAPASPAFKADDKDLVFEDSAPKAGAGDKLSDKSADAPTSGQSFVPNVKSSLSNVNGDRSAVSGDPALLDAQRDIASLEAQLDGKSAGEASELKTSRIGDGNEDSDVDGKPANGKKKKKKAANYKLSVEPKFWTSVPFLKLSQAMIAAHAEESAGGGGGEAAQILYGIAAMMAAIAPAIAIGIQAQSDQKIAQINATAQIDMANIASQTSITLAAQQAAVAKSQTQATQQISQQNQASTTQRLQLQLAELRQARQQATQFEAKRLQFQQNIDQQRLNLAKVQAEKTIDIADRQYRDSLTQNGSLGVGRVQDSNALQVQRGLSTTGYGPGYQYPTTIAANAAANGRITPTGQAFMPNQEVRGFDGFSANAPTAKTAVVANSAVANKAQAVSVAGNGMSTGVRGAASDRLLATVDGTAPNLANPQFGGGLSMGAGLPTKSLVVASSSGQPSAAIQPGLRGMFSKTSSQKLVRGSFASPSERNRIGTDAQARKRDLRRFMGGDDNQPKFSEFISEPTAHTVHPREPVLGGAPAPTQDPNSRAYNAPAFSNGDAGHRRPSSSLGQIGF